MNTHPFVESTRALVAETTRRLAKTRASIMLGRRLLNPAWGISGGAGEDLSGSVRDRLERGSLPAAPRKVWAAWGTWRTCIICSRSITPSEIENEASLDGTPVWSHLGCLRIWRAETAAYETKQLQRERASQGDLCSLVRDGFAVGTLLVLPHNQSWIGRGLNGRCSVCRQPVSPGEVAYEVLGGLLGQPAYAHPACYRVWLVESIAYRRSRQKLIKPLDRA
jgi:hypothetical protein